MLSQLIEALVQSTNGAADALLLDALRLGSEPEKAMVLNVLIRRRTVEGLCGVIAQYNDLLPSVQVTILQNIKAFHAALRECTRGKDSAAILTAMRLIAIGRQGKLAYLLSEVLHHTDDAVSKAAAEALVGLARWAATETRHLQRGEPMRFNPDPSAQVVAETDRAGVYSQLMAERFEIEQVVARAIDVHRGRHGHELLRAALLLADWSGSKTLAVLQTTKHGGQTAMIRRLQQVPDSEHAEAFLLAASHANLRTHFGIVFSHIDEPPVLDAILRKTHWLKDQQLQICMRQVSRGVWWERAPLEKDLARRDNDDVARIGEWLVASGAHDVVQDERLDQLRVRLTDYLPGRIRLLRTAMQRPRGTATALLRCLLNDPDERIARMAAREFVRRKPPEYENVLIQLMASASDSVRRIIGRCVGQVGFDYFWQRYDRLEKEARKTAGRAMLRMLPDGLQRLERRIRSGPIEQRIKAIQIVQDLEVGEPMTPILLQACHDPNPKLRSKAVALLANLKSVPPDALLEQVLHDSDARVRANAIEVLEATHRVEFVPLLTERARSAHNRERANAIKALHGMRVGTASNQLLLMLQDERAEHRISALWALHQIGWWQLINEVGKLAKSDSNSRVRRYAMAVLRNVAEALHRQRKAAG
ncbi:MAG: HEAT repeat domain-containing protein [Bacillota bacterium]